jgi:hypothetical protein
MSMCQSCKQAADSEPSPLAHPCDYPVSCTCAHKGAGVTDPPRLGDDVRIRATDSRPDPKVWGGPEADEIAAQGHGEN